MKRSVDRILTTHCGSLPRPKDLLDLMKAKINGEPYDPGAYPARVRSAVSEIVRQQMESGIDIPTDGEQGKQGFFAYVTERLAGFEPKPGPRPAMFQAEVEAFPEYYKQYFSTAMLGVDPRSFGSVCLHRPGLLSRPGSGAAGHRKSESRASGSGASGRLYAGGSAERRGKERVLPHLRRIHARGRRGSEHGVPGDRRCGLPAPDRRSVSHRTLQLLDR